MAEGLAFVAPFLTPFLTSVSQSHSPSLMYVGASHLLDPVTSTTHPSKRADASNHAVWVNSHLSPQDPA
jgi:hypothetical protein